MASGAKKKQRSYSYTDMEAALSAAKIGQDKVTVYGLSKTYGIPISTLNDRLNGRSGEVMGRPSVLTEEEETALCEYAKYLADRGFPLTVRVIKALAHQIEIKQAKARGSSSKFKETGPGKKWWRGFRRRHPDLSLRSPDQLDKERAMFATQKVVIDYFMLLEDVLTEANAKDRNPHVIYNADETGVDLSAKVSKVIVPRWAKRSPSRRGGSRDHVSALICVSAAGQTVPPMIIFNKSFPGGSYTEGGPANAIYAYSESGFVDDVLFEKWFTQSFVHHAHKDRPVVLIVDQHYSHFTLKVLEAAVSNNIIILGLPPHTTHFLQPLDVAIFSPLKTKWAQTLEVMQAANPHFQVTKRNFAKIFSNVYDTTISPSLIKNSFKKTGIFPLNDDAIDDRWVRMSTKESGEEIVQVPSSAATSLDSLQTPSTSTSLQTPSTSTSLQAPSPSTSLQTPSCSTASCQVCHAPCTICHPIHSPLIKRIVPPALQDLLLPISTPQSSTRNTRKRLIGRVLTHNEVMDEIRKKEAEKKEKEERKEKRKAELTQKREEKRQKEMEKSRKKEERKIEAQKKLEEMEARKRKRQEKLQASKKKRHDEEGDKENQRQPTDASSSPTVTLSRQRRAPTWLQQYETSSSPI
ncbi:uncharacterized protein [Branchiostoma lanceolatum]|uniref:uncharacterized protein n=2 Tax=Branchiostoma lanceolatum TaxID=7740 RepID=UPI001132D56A